MKRKLLLFFAMLCVSIGTWAADDFTLTKTETYYPVNGCVYSVSGLNPGDLANALDNTSGSAYDVLVNNSNFGQNWTNVTFKIEATSTLNEADLQALEKMGVKITSIDISGASFDTDASVSDIKSKANYLMLPSATSMDDIQTINTGNNPNLKVAGSLATKSNVKLPYTKTSSEYSSASGDEKVWVSDRTYSTFNELSVYSFAQNNMYGFSSVFELTNTSLNKLNMAGSCGEQELLGVNQWGQESSNFKKDDLHYFDFTGATFEGTSLSKLQNYNVMTCVLPTGNTEIPAKTFNTNNGGWSSPICEITIPDSYTTIGDEAFYGCHLSELTLPKSITSVGLNAFATSPTLETIEMEPLDNTCHFDNYVFASCPALKHVTLSENVENIGDYQFNQCGLLESIRIPSTCKTIGSYAFSECYSIHQMTIPEGVDLIKQCAFEGAGITDLYIMATTPATVPKIYAMSPDGENEVNTSTFTYQRSTGNNTSPQAHRNQMGEGSTVHYEEAISWYQAEQSGQKGLGTGNCLTAIHYPESMKPFYEAFDVTQFYTEEQLAGVTDQYGRKAWFTPAEYLAMVPETDGRRDYVALELQNKKMLAEGGTTSPAYDFGTDEQGNPILYQYIPQAYAVDAFPTGHGNDPVIGPDADGRYYPNQHDYWIRLAAGATGTEAGGVNQGDIALPFASAWGWRQFPLSYSLESIGEIPFEKEYDDTWYTMCFPWKMEDNQLFMAFNQKCEIVEFVGAEVLQGEDEYSYNLVFHFDDVAKTYYMDDNDVEYTRERDGDKVDGAGHRIYKYTSKVDGTVVTCPDAVLQPGYDPKSASEEVKEAYGKYLGIKNIMVFPGHPYMIHPSIGAAPGKPAKVYINGVKKIEVGEGKKFATLAAVAESQKVERTVTSNNAGGTSTTAWKNPVTGAGGKYTFIGNINDAKETDDPLHPGAQNMPTDKGPVYFLGVKDEHTYYPQFFKKPKGKGQGKWSQYTAIIVPDDDAIANVEGLDGMAVGSGSTAPAKGYDVVFGEWEIVDEATVVTAIENAQAEAEETGKPAQITHMNVVYNIKGQVVRADSSSVEGLPKGLYIVNGKKYMVK